MKRSSNLHRRGFLQVTAAAAAAGTGAVTGCSRAGKRYRFLTDQEAATLAAICDVIIPPDDFPGGAEAGCVTYIDRQLAGVFAHWQKDYITGLQEIEQASQEEHGAPFTEITAEQRTALVEARENTSFFRMVCDHTMQGFYGDPRHGGNRNFVSWEMMGIPHPPVRGREHYDLTQLTKES